MFSKFQGNRLTGKSDTEEHDVLTASDTPITAQTSHELTIVDPTREDNCDRLQLLKTELHQHLLRHLNLSVVDKLSETELHVELAKAVKEQIDTKGITLTEKELTLLVKGLSDEITGLGPLETLMRDDSISDVLVNGPKSIYIERDGRLSKSKITFQDARHLHRVIDKMVSNVGRRIDELSPYVDARLKDGSRINAVIHPIALDGPFVSIRKRRAELLSIQDLVKLGSFDENVAKYLSYIVKTRRNIVISGGTGSGKTTLLNSLSSFIPSSERVITIEDTAELQLQQEHVVRIETRPPNTEGKGAVTQRQCLANALRMRPDRIIIGETRAEEVIDMLQAMNTGHDGSMTTIHSNSARDATYRIENMYLMSGMDIPIRALRAQIASAIHVIIQTSRMTDGSRCITEIQEISGMEGETIMMEEIFSSKGSHTGHGSMHSQFYAEDRYNLLRNIRDAKSESDINH